MDKLNYEKLAARVRRNEGLSYLPYRCSAGALTIGYGHNLDARGIDIEVAELLLKQDLEIAEKEVNLVAKVRRCAHGCAGGNVL